MYQNNPFMHNIFSASLLLQIAYSYHYDFDTHDNKNANEINVSYGGISSVSNIEKLVNVQKLSFFKNMLTSLPNEVWKLKKLEELDLSYNYLKHIGPEIENMKNLKRLIVYNNRLESLDPSIGEMTELTELDLRMNNLKFLPSSIQLLKKLKQIDLRGNKICSTGNDKQLGKKELKEIFGDHIKLDKNGTENPEVEEVSKNFGSRPTYWNFNNLEKLRPSSKHTEENLTDPLQVLYKNLIGAILDILSESDENVISSTINRICDVLKSHPDGQIYEVMFIYCLLKKNVVEGLEENNYDYLKTFIEGALNVFYVQLDPNHLINMLTNLINSKRSIMHIALHMIANDQTISSENKTRMRVMDKGQEVQCITEEFVKYYLLKMGAIAQNEKHYESIESTAQKSIDENEELYESAESEQPESNSSNAENWKLQGNADESIVSQKSYIKKILEWIGSITKYLW